MIVDMSNSFLSPPHLPIFYAIFVYYYISYCYFPCDYLIIFTGAYLYPSVCVNSSLLENLLKPSSLNGISFKIEQNFTLIFLKWNTQIKTRSHETTFRNHFSFDTLDKPKKIYKSFTLPPLRNILNFLVYIDYAKVGSKIIV